MKLKIKRCSKEVAGLSKIDRTDKRLYKFSKEMIPGFDKLIKEKMDSGECLTKMEAMCAILKNSKQRKKIIEKINRPKSAFRFKL